MIKKVIKQISLSYINKAMTFVLLYSFNILIARKLSVQDYGGYAYIMALANIAIAIAYLGQNMSTQKFVAQHKGTDRINDFITSSLILRIVSVGFATLLLAFLGYMYAFNNQYNIYTKYIVGIVALTVINEYFKSIFIGLHDNLINIAINALDYGLKLLLLIIGTITLSRCFNIYIVSLICSSLLAFYILFNRYPIKKAYIKISVIKELLFFSLPLLLMTTISMAVLEIDIIMLKQYTDLTAVANYNVAKKIIYYIPQISYALVIGTMPVILKMTKKQVGKYFLLLITFTIALAIAISTLIYFLSDHIILLLYDDKYPNAANVMKILSFYILFVLVNVIFSGFFRFAGRVKILCINIGICIVITLISNYILIKQNGAAGAAQATVITSFIYLLCNIVAYWRFIKSKLADEIFANEN